MTESIEMMPASAPTGWERIANNADAITALGTAGLLVTGVLAAWVGIRTLRSAKRDSAARTRPYVYAKLEPSIGSRQAWDLVIKNTGQTAAKNLTLEASQWPEKDDEVTKQLKRLFATRRTLPPETSIRTYWNLDPLGKDDGQNAGVTDPIEVAVNYSSTDEKTCYSETYQLDHTTVGMVPLAWSGSNTSGGNWSPEYQKLKELVQSINELRRNV